MVKFLSGLAIFIIACLLQFSFVPAGITINFIFATLIAFSFVFPQGWSVPGGFARRMMPVGGRGGFWELSFFVLAGVFLMNWMPAPSIALAVFAAMPILAYFFGSVFPFETWIGVIFSLFAGFLILYLVAVPQFIIVAMSSFLLDLFAGSAFGLLVFLCMDRAFGAE